MQDPHAAVFDGLKSIFGELKFSIIELLEEAAQNYPERPALLAPGRASISYSALLDQAKEVVRTLNGLGLTHESRVALALPTTQEAAATYLCVMAGMTIIPLNPLLSVDECERYLQQATVDALIVTADGSSTVREAAARLDIRLIEMVPVAAGPSGAFSLVADAAQAANEPQYATPDDLAVLMPTSGTTALPKLVPWTGRQQILGAYLTAAPSEPQRRAEVGLTRHLLALAPLYHTAGLSGLLVSLVTREGFSVIGQFDVEQVYRTLALYKTRSFYALPSMLGAMIEAAPRFVEQLEQLDIQLILVGSAALSDELLQATQRTFGAAVHILYGMTEVPYIANTTQSLTDPDYRPGSVGKTAYLSQVKIADEDGAELSAGESGEILVRSLHMFRGYWNNPAANADSFRDGWFRTGDSGYLDVEGYLYLTGRIKEVINRGGGKVSPLEIEEVLLRHPAVAEAAAFGFPHAALGEDIAVAVVLRDPSTTERDLRQFAAQQLPLTKVPSRFVFVAELPKTSLGKVRRTALAAQFSAELQR